MKMHHLSQEEVGTIMGVVKELLDGGGELDPAKVEEIFKLSKVNPDKFLECKSNELQADKVNFEIDQQKGVRFFDPFNFFTQGIYKDMDGLSVWTTDNLKEPWSYDSNEES
ncbi:MAG: hypothetical protein G3M78_10010 [Candidatus Nitrohelix vancouverensis]|uniref:Uncharacterized protein n=1 Tax=Candidatus Nitrohelix vancouverensis TaxID=2705534 RepID=A0A7T0C392_9BACT|nr:MAG: hypothetical protein G3M78_10010 [Candidatus Nitrohelix vancouverensis]